MLILGSVSSNCPGKVIEVLFLRNVTHQEFEISMKLTFFISKTCFGILTMQKLFLINIEEC